MKKGANFKLFKYSRDLFMKRIKLLMKYFRIKILEIVGNAMKTVNYAFSVLEQPLDSLLYQRAPQKGLMLAASETTQDIQSAIS